MTIKSFCLHHHNFSPLSASQQAEIFQWRSDFDSKRELPGFTPADKLSVGQELSDVLLYTIRMADVCGVDLGRAVLEKIALNALKYPAERCRGSSAKYNSLPPAASSGTALGMGPTVVGMGLARGPGSSNGNGAGSNVANGSQLFGGGSSGAFGAGGGSFGSGGGGGGVQGAVVKKERSYAGGAGGSLGVAKTRIVGMLGGSPIVGAAGGLEGNVGFLDSSSGLSGLSFDSTCEAMKRRRFTDDQVTALEKVL